MLNAVASEVGNTAVNICVKVEFKRHQSTYSHYYKATKYQPSI